jgi:hypothetical protein
VAAPNTDALAVLAERQELDPGGFKRSANRVERARPEMSCATDRLPCICGSATNGEDYARLRAALRRAMRGEWHRASESLLRKDSLSDFNDGCNDFAELRALIVQARATAMNDGDPEPAPRRRLDIERDKLVMA